jgi:hypothetical protein
MRQGHPQKRYPFTKMMKVYTHVLNQGLKGVRSPMDEV